MTLPWLRRRAALKVLETRESLSEDAVYERYYASTSLPKERVVELWNEVATTLRVPASKVRPEDRFGKEVGAYWITSDDLDALAAKGRRRAKSSGLNIDFEKLATVDEYVKALARR